MKKQAAILGLTLAIGATAFAVKPSEASAKTIHSIPKAMRGTWYTYSDDPYYKFSVLKVSSTGMVWKLAWDKYDRWIYSSFHGITSSRSGWVRASVMTGSKEDYPIRLRISKYKPAGYSKRTTLQVKQDELYQRYTRKKVNTEMEKWILPLP